MTICTTYANVLSLTASQLSQYLRSTRSFVRILVCAFICMLITDICSRVVDVFKLFKYLFVFMYYIYRHPVSITQGLGYYGTRSNCFLFIIYSLIPYDLFISCPSSYNKNKLKARRTMPGFHSISFIIAARGLSRYLDHRTKQQTFVAVIKVFRGRNHLLH